MIENSPTPSDFFNQKVLRTFHEFESELNPNRNRIPIGKVASFDHRRQTCDYYFPNSLQPISYLRNICDIYVLGLKKICRKNNQISWTRDSQCQNSANSLAKNTQNAYKNFSPICLNRPSTKV